MRLAALATALAVVLAGWLVGGSAAAQGQQVVSIAGQVVNGTEGGTVPEGLMVRLAVISPSSDGVTGFEMERREVAVDGEGRFRFDDVAVEERFICRVVALARNYTPVADLEPCAGSSDLRLVIWDTTDALDDITLLEYSVVVPVASAEDESLLFLASARVRNSGDRIWVPDLLSPGLTGLDLLRFNLPRGFFELNVEEGVALGIEEGILQTIPTGFALSTPIPPGDEYRILASYGAPYEGGSTDLEFRLPHGASQFSFHLQPQHGTVTAPELTYTGSVPIGQDGVYERFAGADLERGAAVAVRLTGLPQPSLGDNLSDFFSSTGYVWLLVGGLVAGLGALLAFALLRRRRRVVAEPELWEDLDE